MKMKIYESPKSYFNTIKLGSQIFTIWPSKIGANKIERLLHEIKWLLAFTSATLLLAPQVLGVYFFRQDSVLLIKLLSETTSVIEVFMNLLLCKIQNNNFQVILEEMENFIQNANKDEEQILKKYLSRYKNVQKTLAISFCLTASSFICMPLLTAQHLPSDGWYPFSTEPFLIRIPLYISQAIGIAQIGTGCIVDFLIATMLWFYAVKTKILTNHISQAKGKMAIKHCAYQHQLLILSTDRVAKGVKYIILKTNLTMCMGVVCGAFQIINHEPFQVVIRFILKVAAGSWRLYVTARPADDLKKNSEKLAEAAFFTAAQQQSLSDTKLAFMLARRCQKPITISVTAIIEAYCLEYYGSFLATSVRFLVNLRAVVDK